MTKCSKGCFDSVELRTIARIKDTAHLTLGNAEFLGKRNLTDPGFAPSAINSNLRR